jgi:hypothetical protein
MMNLGDMLGDDAAKKLREEQSKRDKELHRKRKAQDEERRRRLGMTIKYTKRDDD